MQTITKAPPQHDYRLRSMVTAEQTDRDAKIIRGVTVLQAGPLNDSRPNIIDNTTLAQVVEIGNSNPKGVKARWTHPNLSSDGLGNFVGRWKNFRLAGDSVLADLHLAKQAFRGGEDSRGNWILEMAESDHDAFGVSLAPTVDEQDMKEATMPDGKQPYRIVSLQGIDIVDEPAATRGGLFGGRELSVATAPGIATQTLDTLFADADASVVRQRALTFLDAYMMTRFGETAAPLATAPPAVVDDMAARLEERQRVLELFALSDNAGTGNQLASTWATQGYTLDQAKAFVQNHYLATNPLSLDAGLDEPRAEDKFREEYRANSQMLAKAGVTMADYIASRMVDQAQDA